ncbi:MULTISPECIES: methionine ABC transporter permease [unclassified Corynebacterium]|uniref:methionine ABC transporter permease n=1 Tax=unclassified Corynebacterium TaxID=2624378 RepID=UPI0021AA2754|nr:MULTISPECIES: methionine ABC transporter permease [unclassified Corynebacterium]MCT1452015.1 ABC transporter permease [Corynebacterium sp. p3-SID1145]MCT1461010.1 ABC transporter permease [Corynebacterium sp. p3-SID1140]MDN8595319.1 methionine ABC transporter permease [Corynebacterium sp. P4_F2]WKK54805.1 methionine ABC transporter permease [Corynebacterium sp. P4-C1]WKK64182.1 methionine ABC transporter permease [Corynebacterium sp. P8-C1]
MNATNELILAAGGFDWDRLGPTYFDAIADTLFMVVITMIVGGFFGLILGLFLYTTREGNVLQNKFVYWVLNILVNFFRPIPFIIMIAMLYAVTLAVVGTTIGREAATFVMCVTATFTVARIVEQNLVAIDPGVIEAARAMGAGPWRIIRTVIIPEALGPLILGFTFIFIAVIDMSAMAGYIGGGGLGDFAIVYGYRAYQPAVTWLAVITIVIIVQLAQLLGNYLSRKVMRR